MVRDLNSKDEEVRHRAEVAYNMLVEFGVDLGGGGVKKKEREGWRLHNVLDFVDEDGDGDAGGTRQVTSAAEARRRRREAVVIHEGSGAVGVEDLYMRD
jgi:hypothetical protein